MGSQTLGDLIIGVVDACEVCRYRPYTKFVTLNFKTSVSHDNPDCECSKKPLKVYMCDTCAAHAVQCSTGECKDGEACDVTTVKVQTDTEAADEFLAVKAIEQGTTVHALRFGMAYRLDVREATTVLEALEAAGVPVDFTPMRPAIGRRVRTSSGGPNTSGEPEPPIELAAESGKRPKNGGGTQQAAWPQPRVYLPNDGNIH